MYNDNICLFVPQQEKNYSLQTVHFVLETNPCVAATSRWESVYKMYYVRSGHSNLCLRGKSLALTAGDVFFTFPGEPFSIEGCEELTYMYISFLGTRVGQILQDLGISGQNCIFHDCAEVCTFWERGLTTAANTLEWISESILLYTFSFLGNRTAAPTSAIAHPCNIALTLKKHIEDHFSDPTFSLDLLSRRLSYNKKYLSSAFKRHWKVGIVEYLNTVRIQNAFTLINQGLTSISDIATRCGYTDPQYFSKVFKAKVGVSPTIYIRSGKGK